MLKNLTDNNNINDTDLKWILKRYAVDNNNNLEWLMKLYTVDKDDRTAYAYTKLEWILRK